MSRLKAGLLALIFLVPAAFAAENEGKTVSAVQFKGLERVSEQVVRAKVEVQPGQAYNPRAVSRDLRRLYELGFFNTIEADLAPEDDGVALTYIVDEKRVIDDIQILGAKKIRPRKVRGALTMREGQSFVAEACDDERDAILKLYESKGFANTEVDIAVEKVGPSRVRMIYDIHEGRKARIQKIEFVGNDAMAKRKLRKIMKTHRAYWVFGGKFEEEKFESDLEKILDEYGNLGRLEAAIPKTEFTYNENGKRMRIAVHLFEGPVYHVETLDIANNEVYDDDEVSDIIEVHAGDVHNKGQVTKDAELVAKGYQDSGYVNADDTPQVTLDREKKTTHLVHRIEEGDLKYVRQVAVTGNQVTKDEIIRREMMLRPGDRFDGSLMQASKRRLDNTEYFDTVRLTLADVEDHELFTDLNVDVEEGKTGNFNFGAGYSTDEGVGGFAELRFDNFDIADWPHFAGAGQQLRLKFNIGDVRNQYSLSFTEPEFLGYPLAAGFDIFNESYKVQGGANYTEEEMGGQLRVGKALSPYVTVRASLRISEMTISDLPELTHADIREQSGGHLTISTRWEIERNTLDNNRDPSSGARHLLATQFAGFGGDYEYVKFEHDSNWFWGFGEEKKWVLSLRVREGLATAYGGSDSVPLQERLYAGGASTVRGYKNRGIGPKAKEHILYGSDFALGGNLRGIANLEMKYKLTDMVRLYTFVDAGGVWEYFSDITPGEIRTSAGIGLGVDIPRLGPIRVDYGFPLNPDGDTSRSGRLHLMTGFRF